MLSRWPLSSWRPPPPLPPCGAQHDLRRAISEKVAALDLLASAEKIMLEREAADGGRACGRAGGLWAVCRLYAACSLACL